MPALFAGLSEGARMVRRPGACSRWLRSTREAPGPTARIGGVTLQIVRDWVLRFNAHDLEGLIDRKPSGQPSRLTDAHRTALMKRIDDGPIPSVHGVVRWRLVDLIEWLWEEFRVPISKQTLSREVRALGY